MYTHPRSNLSVHDTAAPYGASGADRYPADDVLADLTRAVGADAAARTQRILARYAALRAWLLQAERAPAPLTSHARDAARLHLSAAARTGAEGWAEGAVLLRLLDAPAPEAAALLAAAAAEAAAAGDRAGAAALRRGGREATLRRLGEVLRRDRRRG